MENWKKSKKKKKTHPRPRNLFIKCRFPPRLGEKFLGPVNKKQKNIFPMFPSKMKKSQKKRKQKKKIIGTFFFPRKINMPPPPPPVLNKSPLFRGPNGSKGPFRIMKKKKTAF